MHNWWYKCTDYIQLCLLYFLYRAMISVAAKEICDADKFQELCKILLREHYYNELAEKMQVVYCVLKCEKNILEQQNYHEILSTLKQNKFYDVSEEKMLLETNKIEVIMNILKSKRLHYFSIFLFSLKTLLSCNTLVHKIESK